MMSSDHEMSNLLAAFDFAQASAAAETAHRQEMETLLLAIIEVIDSLQTLDTHYGDLAGSGGARVPIRGTGVIVKQALKAITEAGVVPMNCTSQPVDLLFHEVIEVRPAAGVAADTVLEEVQRGYVWRNKVLRHAKVVIAGEANE
jgi:molecular chaperone GrpE